MHLIIAVNILISFICVDVNILLDNNSLLLASKNGHVSIVKYLLENGASVLSENEDGSIDLNHYYYLTNIFIGNNALLYASQSGNHELVEYLISKQAQIRNFNEKRKILSFTFSEYY